MFKHKRLLENIYLGLNHGYAYVSRAYSSQITKIDPFNKILVISKLSRYEFEQRRHKNLTDNELEKLLRNRGTDYEKLIQYHDLHKRFEDNVVTTLENMGFNVTVANRFTCTERCLTESDVVMPIGGDGTFLMAASRVLDNKKPVIGFNSDPNRSEGHLCLPKKYSTNIREAIEKVQNGQFKWLLRNRIRTTILNDEELLVPKYLHEIDNDILPMKTEKVTTFGKSTFKKVVPVLALNEVFIGEALSARVSHLQMILNGSGESTNLKCSGLCVCTGTGSTSWHLSINRLPTQTVAELLRLIDIDSTESKDSLAAVLSETYNKNLIFPPDDKKMGYTIRDLISAGVWPQPKGIKSRGFATNIEVRSNCFDASLVVDGGISFSFNDGTVAVLDTRPEDALRTVILEE